MERIFFNSKTTKERRNMVLPKGAWPRAAHALYQLCLIHAKDKAIEKSSLGTQERLQPPGPF